MNSGLIIPETIFFSTLKAILAFIRNDWNNNTDQTDTIIYKMFKNAGSLEKYKFYDQIRSVIITEDDNPRAFDFTLGFNTERMKIPTCHITLPSENSGQNGLGLDTFEEDTSFGQGQTYTRNTTRRFDCVYNFTFTSDNANETIALYQFWKVIFQKLIDHLELSNLEHIRISGGDLQLNPQIVPPTIFTRNISISFSYDLTVEELFSNDFLSKIIFDMEPPTIPNVEVDESDSGSA